MAETQVNPLASAVHHKAGSDFWQNRAHLLQDALLTAQAEAESLREQVAHRDAELAKRDAEIDAVMKAAATSAAGADRV